MGALVTTAALLASSAAAQEPAGAIRIVSPEADTYVAGPTELTAVVTGGNVVRVTFFADGLLVCRVERPPYRCSWNAGAVIREHAIRVVASFAEGGRAVHTVRTLDASHAEIVSVHAVPVTVTVTDGRGRFVPGLTAEAFRVYENNRLQRIAAVTSERAPLEVVVAVDISGSMEPAMARVRDAVSRFLAALPARHPVSVLAFNDNVFTVIERSTDAAARAAAVAELSAWGGTRLFDAILSGLDLLRAGTGRKALVVFTDGDDVASRTTLTDLEAHLEASDVTVYAIGQGRGADHKDFQALLQRLSERTGGRSFATGKPAELQRAFADIVNELSHQYLLSYEPENTTRDGTWRAIKVELVPNGYRTRARQGYRAALD